MSSWPAGSPRSDLAEPRARHPSGRGVPACNSLVHPKDRRADADVTMMEPEGAPPMSGSSSMYVATVRLDAGISAMPDPRAHLVREAPGGPVTARGAGRGDKARRIFVQNLPRFASERGVTPGSGAGHGCVGRADGPRGVSRPDPGRAAAAADSLLSRASGRAEGSCGAPPSGGGALSRRLCPAAPGGQARRRSMACPSDGLRAHAHGLHPAKRPLAAPPVQPP